MATPLLQPVGDSQSSPLPQVRPLGPQGKLQLAKDLAELQQAIGQSLYPLEQLVLPYRTVKAFRALLFQAGRVKWRKRVARPKPQRTRCGGRMGVVGLTPADPADMASPRDLSQALLPSPRDAVAELVCSR